MNRRDLSCPLARVGVKGLLPLVCLSLGVPKGLAETVIEVRCGPEHGKVETPVMVKLDAANPSLQNAFILVEDGTARRIAGQIISEPGRMLCFVMPPRTMEGGVRRFRVTTDRPGPAGVAFDDSKPEAIVVTDADKPVASYIRKPILKKGVPPRYRRCCYMHPVYDLDGTVLTDDFPRDHFHHRGMSWAWPRVEHAGRRYDMWHLAPLHPLCKRILSTQGGPVCGVLRSEEQWVLKERPVVRQLVELCFWRTGEIGRVIDVFLTLTALKEPVTIGGRLTESKGYGGFNVRFAPRRDTILFGPNGRQPGNVNRVPMAWSDLSAKFVPGNERVSGLAIFDGPDNPGFPSGWSNRAYGYLNPAWPGLGTYELKPGKPLRLRYRVYIHRGDAVTGKAVQAQRAFVSPPQGRTVTQR